MDGSTGLNHTAACKQHLEAPLNEHLDCQLVFERPAQVIVTPLTLDVDRFAKPLYNYALHIYLQGNCSLSCA